MKNITRHTGTLKKITRMKNSRDGNPQFMLYCDGYKFRTQANASIGYNIDSYFDKDVTVTIGLYRNCLTLNTIHLNQGLDMLYFIIVFTFVLGTTGFALYLASMIATICNDYFEG